ncbi:Gfo/Idh/MocA family protein [Janibacter cremeus]|uniref:Myo-inositol 2-dehydrogenase/D-chiro-inositol 1-dehydrogenase n=1 Tax=Janibacter cremeus TaxID=1285192 RepID=A0A852VQ18_9MICO|nr:Gfo/Idh/MocA family oxidoreductase [Janibacter cremeus]NYF98286.1 myo-inositol 2-dehydrogenase/D-chiro-inositol 1-dehydrogenase [Janibacter cremeus]
MRIGLIGLGRIGSFHADTLAGLETVDELVVTDPVAAAVDAVTGRIPQARAVDSPQALLDSGVDGVVIAAATNTHAELIRAAVAKGVPTFCEKPVAGTIAESLAVERAVAGSDVPVQIGYPRRFDPAFVAARDAVRAGELGRITTVRSTTLDPAPPPAAYLAVSGGIFRDCSVHDFDAVRWVTGQEVVDVHAVGAVDPDAPEEMYAANGDHSSASVLLTLADGTIGVVSNTRTNGRGYDVRLEVHGVRDAVAAGLDEGLPLRSTQPGVTWPSGPAHEFFMDRLAQAFRLELAAFTRVATGAIDNPCTVADAMGTAWTAEAATLSASEHRPVSLEEVRGTAMQ